MNEIPTIQNMPKQLARLRAQRALYSRAKSHLALQIVLSVPFAVFWSVLGMFSPESKVYAGVWGFAIAALDLFVFTPWQKALKSKAAKIQEAFDCDVLCLDWRSIKAGSRPDPEDVRRWSASTKSDPDKKTRDWYPIVVGQIRLPLARIVCQRANCWWDAQLRRRYARASQAVVVSVMVLTVFAGIIGRFRVDQWILSGVIPLLPVVVLGLRQSSEQMEAANRLDNLRKHTDRLWSEALAGAPDDQVTVQSRELQDEILDHRSRDSLIFDWIYDRLRNEQEDQMNRAAEDLVAEAKDSGSSRALSASDPPLV
jgi:hypothetical protein